MSNASEPASAVQESSSTMSILPILQRGPSFEKLPIELHIMILHQIASPRDLSATFRASPTALGAFLSCREAIVASVIQRHISPEIFCHYEAVLTAPNYDDFNFVAPFDPGLGYNRNEPYSKAEHEELRWSAWLDFARKLYKTTVRIASRVRSRGEMGKRRRFCTLENGRFPAKEEVEIFKQKVQNLAVMYGTVERFTKDFQAFSFNVTNGRQADLQKLEFSNPPDDPNVWPALSPSEQTRLQRGLLRYELCCRLLGSPFILRRSTAIGSRWYSEDDPYEIIKYLMPSWEFQEIVAVRTYVQRKYNLLHLNTQDEFLVDIQSLDKRLLGSVSQVVNDSIYKQQAVPTSKEPQCRMFTTWSDLEDTMGPSGHWVDLMSRLGLLVLQNTLRSTAENMLKLHGAMIDWTFILPLRCQKKPHQDEINNSFDCIYPWVYLSGRRASLAGANPVFLAAQGQRGKLRENSIESLYRGTMRLQELGWVFWEDRIRISALRLPFDEDDESLPECHLALHYRDDIATSIRYEVEGLLEQVEEAVITNRDWNSIIAPKYGFLGPGGRMNIVQIKNILVDPFRWWTRPSLEQMPTPLRFHYAIIKIDYVD